MIDNIEQPLTARENSKHNMMQHTNMNVKDVINNPNIFKDYTNKIIMKIDDIDDKNYMKSHDFNSMIVLLNWCFTTRNDFFVNNLNKKFIKVIAQTYNQLKSNIIDIGEGDVFNHITQNNLKTLKFILYQYINAYDSLVDEYHECLINAVSKQSIKNCIKQINDYMKENEDSKL